MDSPSVFGAILDRDAGGFRLGPADVAVPAARRYLPGTMVLETSWGTADRLDHRARRAADRAVAPRGRALAHATAARRPTTTPSTCCCARSGASTARSRSRWTASRCFDYGRERGALGVRRRRLPRRAMATRRGVDVELRLTTDLRLGFEGPRAVARTLLKEGETRFVRAVLERARRRRTTYDEAYERLVWTAHHWQHWLARGHFPDHPWRTLPAAQRADAEGPDLRADRRAGRRGDDVAAGDARRRAQLGLPLHAGSATRRSRCGACTRSASTGRPTTSSTSSPTSPSATTSCRSCTAIDGERDARRAASSTTSAGYEGAEPVRIGNGAYDQQQHDVWGAVLDSVYLHTRSRDRLDERLWPILDAAGRAARIEHWREPDRGIWEVRGEPQHFTSSKIMCWVALRPRRAAGASCARSPSSAERWQARGRRDPRRHLRQRRRRAGRLHPALRHRRRSTPRCC